MSDYFGKNRLFLDAAIVVAVNKFGTFEYENEWNESASKIVPDDDKIEDVNPAFMYAAKILADALEEQSDNNKRIIITYIRDMNYKMKWLSDVNFRRGIYTAAYDAGIAFGLSKETIKNVLGNEP